jgi:hypothetical protein
MLQNNVYTVAKRTLEGQDMVYQSIKFTNDVWALAELKIQPGNPTITVSYGHPTSLRFSLFAADYNDDRELTFILCSFQLALKSRAVDVCQGIYQMYDQILRN